MQLSRASSWRRCDRGLEVIAIPRPTCVSPLQERIGGCAMSCEQPFELASELDIPGAFAVEQVVGLCRTQSDRESEELLDSTPTKLQCGISAIHRALRITRARHRSPFRPIWTPYDALADPLASWAENRASTSGMCATESVILAIFLIVFSEKSAKILPRRFATLGPHCRSLFQRYGFRNGWLSMKQHRTFLIATLTTTLIAAAGCGSGRKDRESGKKDTQTHDTMPGDTNSGGEVPTLPLPPDPEEPVSRILFTNVRIFDGLKPELITDKDVLVEGNVIAMAEPRSTVGDVTVIDCSGRILMPGLIEAHSHLALSSISPADQTTQRSSYGAILSVLDAERMLMNGVTTTRDAGGEVFSLKRAIDEGKIPGPRIYPSGAMISQTSGHADFRFPNQLHPAQGGPVPFGDLAGNSVLVDGVPQMLAAVREQLRLGATQIKLAGGGGVSSPTDPIDVTEFSEEETRAAVGAAEDWGTYVMMHAYTVSAVNRAITAGVKVIEHGHLLDEATLKRMITEDVWLSFQPFTECSSPHHTPAQNEKQAIVCKGTDTIYEYIRTMEDLKVVHGTDILSLPEGNDGQVEQLEPPFLRAPPRRYRPPSVP